MTRVVLSDEAMAEIAAAAHWYEERQQHLGSRFLDEVDRTILRIAARPQGFSRIALTDATLDVRRALLDVFPYAVVFTSLPAEVRVLAVSHTRRNPEILAASARTVVSRRDATTRRQPSSPLSTSCVART